MKHEDGDDFDFEGLGGLVKIVRQLASERDRLSYVVFELGVEIERCKDEIESLRKRVSELESSIEGSTP